MNNKEELNMEFNDNIADDEWEWYIGQLFSKIIKDINMVNIKNVVEIAPRI